MPVADPLIDLHALWQILLAGLAGGVGVVIAFGFVILGRTRYETSTTGATRAGYVALTTVAAAFCLAALVLGFVAMTHK